MIVCVCNNISEGKIHQAVNAGMTSMSELRKELGVGAGCGKCHTCAKHVLRECLSNSNQTRNTVQAMVFHANAIVA
ncbi:bacterioferritin-associated ferredoxin [Herbaspirillum sp. CF444]|uniref:(2Fe-2S)-binding protein n=1 Tax=Herbaspirillum sp. CF444 TaxID=1144319 RepID=UPI00027239E5|nr:(2Fe-2S)-binding protein [Herbaspirillum sp. CF444]EJL90795.1 bacterioferritin-associated ferredoxin [Herbaspirillum sp. CF444]